MAEKGFDGIGGGGEISHTSTTSQVAGRQGNLITLSGKIEDTQKISLGKDTREADRRINGQRGKKERIYKGNLISHGTKRQ